MGRKKTRAADIKRKLSEDDASLSPFASIKLVEKKEPEKKKPLVKPVPKKPSEIVQGYNPSSSFADILYAYEHTGNPYSMPSPSKKAKIASQHTDFGAILDKWEGRTAEPPKKKKVQEVKKSSYKPTKSFGEILSSFEGGNIPQKTKEKKTEVVEDFPDDKPLFRKESDDEKRSPEAAWSIFGGNEGFVRKEEKIEAPVEKEEIPVRVSKPYSPTKSFGDILQSFEGGVKKKDEKKSAEVQPKETAPAEVPLSDNLFKKESDDEKRSPDAVWSVFGNNRILERKSEAAEEVKDEVRKEDFKPYTATSPFSSILSEYEKKSEKTFDEIMKEKGDAAESKPQLTINKLRAMMPQATLDLHGYTVSEAEKSIRSFLEECKANHLRKISIITGKGLHSEDGVGVLRATAIRVLDESGVVSEKGSAPLSAGGAGALWIILKA